MLHTFVFHAVPLAVAFESTPTELGSGPDLTRYLIVCVLLVAGVAGLGWGFKVLFARSLGRRAAERSLRVVDLMPISGKHKLAVVRCYDRTFVLGLGEREVNLITELDPVIEAEGDEEPRLADRTAFAEIVEHLRARTAAPLHETGSSLRGGIFG